VIGEAGVLIRGPSGAGKSGLAYCLAAAAEGAGYFARLVGDDRIGLEARGGRLIAHGHPSILGQIERRSQGVFHVPFLPAAVVRLIIDIAAAGEAPLRFPEPEDECVTIEGVRLPLVRLRQDAAAGGLALSILADLRLRRLLP
jgi:serine kinase of HPr protein (carbohydrate metabolism regulator)